MSVQYYATARFVKVLKMLGLQRILRLVSEHAFPPSGFAVVYVSSSLAKTRARVYPAEWESLFV